MTDRRRTPPRPYARQRTWPSVTTVINVMDKPGLRWGAAKETALFAIHHPEEWRHLSDMDAVERLRKHHDVLWQGRAATGTIVHQINEAWSWGETADLVDLIKNMDRPPKVWEQQGVTSVVAELQPYVDGLERFWDDWCPLTVATEQVVRNPSKEHGYIGQTDWTASINGELWRLDLKTTAQSEGDIKPYTDSWRPQLCAYDRAPEIVHYDAGGRETDVVSNYRCDRFGVVHLRGDGTYHLIEVDCGDDVFAVFMAMRQVYEWAHTGHKKPSWRVLSPPEVEEEEAK